MTELDPQIKLYSTSLPSPLPSSPSFIFHLTHLTNTLLIWVGTGQPTDPGTPASEVVAIPSEKKIAQDWAVAMPARGSIPVTSTSLYRGGGDLALAMSQRLARKFPSTQIQLSLSIPASLTSASGPSLDPFASKTLLIMEKQLGVWLGEVLAGEQS